MSAYYNEHDPFAAAWLRELITDGLIADGEVDERDIQTLDPDDLRGFTQCHFFSGIGGWSLALRLAGWPDDRPVWTGSCPCQPFSAAGAQAGGTDPRHLWPAWYHLIRECRPPVLFGEQVESAVAHGWLDLVSDDLEREGYAVGAVCLPAASVGAPHIRNRLWFMADAACAGVENNKGTRGSSQQLRGSGDVEQLGDTHGGRRQRSGEPEPRGVEGPRREQLSGSGDGRSDAAPEQLGHTDGCECRQRVAATQQSESVFAVAGGSDRMGHASSEGQQGAELRGARHDERHGPYAPRPIGESGYTPWADLLWLPCRDGKARATQPGLQPLAHGVPARVGRLRGYGNAIVPQVAAAFIDAYMRA